MFSKTKIIFFLLFIFSDHSFAQNENENARIDLQNLLKERKSRFDIYESSLEKRSGIFGNKTKKDIQSSNNVLIEIVKTDNRIISTLNNVIDFRNFEKSNMRYDELQQNLNHYNLLHATDTLASQVKLLSNANKILEKERLTYKQLFYLTVFLFLIVLIWKFKGIKNYS